jgi:hypothetical protein
MLSLVNRVLAKYKSLVVRMHDDLGTIEVARPILEFLCDVEVVLGLMYIMPTLEVINDLIKFAQSRDTFVCDFVGVVKMCFADLHTFYYDPKKKYTNEQFKGFANLVNCNNDGMLTTWWIDATTIIEYAIFYFQAQQYQIHSKCPSLRLCVMCICDAWVVATERVKEQCSVAIVSFITELV